MLRTLIVGVRRWAHRETTATHGQEIGGWIRCLCPANRFHIPCHLLIKFVRLSGWKVVPTVDVEWVCHGRDLLISF